MIYEVNRRWDIIIEPDLCTDFSWIELFFVSLLPERLLRFPGFTRRRRFFSVIHSREKLLRSYLKSLSYTAYNEVIL